MFEEIIKKQLSAWPKTKKRVRMAYYEKLPAKQIQADTMFWKIVRGKGEIEIPILVIVDVATRYTKYFIQKKKNDSVKDHIEAFLKELREKFPKNSKKTLLITDGAKELAIKTIPDLTHKVSKGLNKAVLAEVKIRQARHILREVELEIDLENLKNNTEKRIDRTNLNKIFKDVEKQINIKAKVREPKPEQNIPQQFDLGDPVLALNLHKFFPFQIGEPLRKTSYDRNWYTEPFYISKVIKLQGLQKYNLQSFMDGKEIKYSFYDDQLQKIDSRVAYDYIKSYTDYVKKRENTDFFVNSK